MVPAREPPLSVLAGSAFHIDRVRLCRVGFWPSRACLIRGRSASVASEAAPEPRRGIEAGVGVEIGPETEVAIAVAVESGAATPVEVTKGTAASVEAGLDTPASSAIPAPAFRCGIGAPACP
ncbi:hypothetical protein BOBR111200_25610 [Bordetella bronchialis]